MSFEENFFEPDSDIHNDIQYSFDVSDFFIPSEGNQIHGLKLHHEGEFKGVVVQFHGNAKNVTSHITHVDWLPAKGFDVLLFDYAGFGKSEGTPTRRTACQNGIDILEYVCENFDRSKKVIIIGQSLGASIACYALSKVVIEVNHLIIDSAFPSFRAVVRQSLKRKGSWLLSLFIPMLISREFDIENTLRNIDTNITVVHGRLDQIAPIKFGKVISRMARCDLWEGDKHAHAEQFRDKDGSFRDKLLRLLDGV